MKILLAGSKGFIGKNIQRYLLNHPVHSLIPVTRKDCDLASHLEFSQYVQQIKPDVIIHTAVALSNTKNNLNMYYALENVSPFVSKIIMLGSGAEYSSHRYKPLMPEDYFDAYSPPQNNDDYHTSKHTISRLHLSSKISNIFNFRLFGIYGMHEDFSRRLISNNIYMYLKEKKMKFNRDIAFDYLYIDDLSSALLHFLTYENPAHRVYNVCSGKADKFSAILEEVINSLGGNSSDIICSDPSPTDYEYSGSNKRFESEFSYNIAKTSYADATPFLHDWINNVLINGAV